MIHHCTPSPSDFLTQWWSELNHIEGPVLDLACGRGRNGLWLARQGIDVTFADKDSQTLREIAEYLQISGLKGDIWEVDLETDPLPDLGCHRFAAILVFRYLHRPLFPLLKKALAPGGCLLYETFTTQQREFGRPKNPAFLLGTNELKNVFSDWTQIAYSEFITEEPKQAIAQWAGYKPVKS